MSKNKFLYLMLLLMCTLPVTANKLSAKGKKENTKNLFVAISNKDTLNTQQLINAYPDIINAQDEYGKTPLMHAVTIDGFQTIVTVLINKRVNVNTQDIGKRTALMHAVLNNRKENVQVLLENGANIELKDNNNKTALDLADQEMKNFIQATLETIEETKKAAVKTSKTQK